MRFLAITYADPNAPEPTPEAYAELAKLGQEGAEQGWLVDTGAITAAEAAIKVSYENGNYTVLDGPYTESKELVAGYGIFNVANHEEAAALSRRFYEIMGGGKGELRQLLSQEEMAQLMGGQA